MNEEVTALRKQNAIKQGRDPEKVPPVVVSFQTRTALDQARKASMEVFVYGESQGTRNIFRDATAAEIKQFKAEKEKEIAAREKEVNRDRLRTAGVVVNGSLAEAK